MCAPEARQSSGLDEVEQLKGLAGITVQDGEHDTKGSLETLKWCKWDPTTRIIDSAVFGTFYDHTGLGLWTEPTTPCCRSCVWSCLMNLARHAGYNYRFQFSEDLRKADIKIRGNMGVVCCCIPICCCPFMPHCTIPDCCCVNTMEQAEDTTDGTHWIRYRGVCCQTPKPYYDLLTVFNADGTDGPYVDKLTLRTPKQLQICR